MTAHIAISPDKRLDLIAIAAGQSDGDKRRYIDGILYVDEVTQQALETAASVPIVIPWTEYAEKAKDALDASDLVAIRCVKAGISFPSNWKNYVSSLRGIVRGDQGPLPDRPSYPEGT